MATALNPNFVADFEKAKGEHWEVVQSHGGSSRQAQKIVRGELQADVVTLGLPSDVDSLKNTGLFRPAGKSGFRITPSPIAPPSCSWCGRDAMAGPIQVLIAVFRLGDLTRYISQSVIMKFMAAAALLLAIGQIGNALGVKDKGTGAQHVLYRLWLTLAHGDRVNPKALAITLATLLLAVAARKMVRRYRLPQFDMLLVLVVVNGAAFAAGWTVPNAVGKTAISVAGAVPRNLPVPHTPVIHVKWVIDLSSDAFAIALLGLLEALAIAKSFATQTRQTLDFNARCRAEGLANLAGAFFQCLRGSGSLPRSAINFQAGAATRFSGILTARLVR